MTKTQEPSASTNLANKAKESNKEFICNCQILKYSNNKIISYSAKKAYSGAPRARSTIVKKI